MQLPYNNNYESYNESPEDAQERFEREMRKKALEIVCYVFGAGAFGLFLRWLQTMLAFNDDGLVDGSVFNVLVILAVFVAAYIFMRFVDKFRNEYYYVPDDFYDAFYNPGKLYTAVRWVCGGIMLAGALVLLVQCETDKNRAFYLVLVALGALSGLAYPLLLSAANRPHVTRQNSVCALAALPIVLFCMWLVTIYKVNAINSVKWAYGPEVVAAIVSAIAFFRVAGYPFGQPNTWRTLFFCMLGGSLDVAMLADTRYIGLQMMFIAAACMQAFYVWLMVCNMGRGEAPAAEQPNDGFERLK